MMELTRREFLHAVTGAAVGSSIADTATVTGLVSPSSGDTVTFNLYSSATTQNSSTLLFTNTQTLSITGGRQSTFPNPARCKGI